MTNCAPTPHISALNGEFAKTVIMPGDPLRAKYIVDNFMKNVKLITSVRNMYGYTGSYKGKEISVMAHGMGAPSVGIYAYELYNFYNVDNIIRVGSAGAVSSKLNLYDIVISMSASHDSNFHRQYHLPGVFAPTASYNLLKNCDITANKLNIPIHIGPTASSDTFYSEREEIPAWNNVGIIAIEMESAALYMTAAACKKNALTIMTISDSMYKKQTTNFKEREQNLNQMIELALETSIVI